MWWYTSVIPACWEPVGGGSQSEAALDKNKRPYLKIKRKKGPGHASSGRVRVALSSSVITVL
jgi:hypothetical protein